VQELSKEDYSKRRGTIPLGIGTGCRVTIPKGMVTRRDGSFQTTKNYYKQDMLLALEQV